MLATSGSVKLAAQRIVLDHRLLTGSLDVIQHNLLGSDKFARNIRDLGSQFDRNFRDSIGIGV